jgi:hypothetical protein
MYVRRYSTFAIGILFVLLLFYSTPSKTERSILLGVLLFLAVNTIIILAAYPIRNDEAWVGIASVLWTLFVTAWAVCYNVSRFSCNTHPIDYIIGYMRPCCGVW